MTSQEAILLSFVQGEDGTEWARKMYGWSKDKGDDQTVDVCDWTGIDCDDEENEGVITKINLSQTNLLATIPAELSLLTSLKKLDLSGNLIMGPIPPEVARLPALEEVVLSKNQLNGPIPTFASLELRILDVEQNKLSQQFPDGFGENHPKMINLNLVGNDLTGTIPDSFLHMENLVWLQLSENHFHGT
jgi:Leucine-rich repeat (LRR) protein